MLSQLFRRNEATWGVVFNGHYYHNFEIYLLEALSFINKPVLSAYVVMHPKWQMKGDGEKKPAARPRLKKAMPFEAIKEAFRRRRYDTWA